MLTILLSAGAALAGPIPPPTPIRKPVPPGMTADNIKIFVKAIVADKAGELHDAISKYEDFNKESGDSANAFYNIADVERRMERLERAIKDYKKYLDLAPQAADRKEVEHLIDQLANADFTVVLDGAEPGALIFLDGKLLGPSPQIAHVGPGMHGVDRISPSGHREGSFEGKPGGYQHEVLDDWSAKKHEGPPGNVVLSKSGTFGSSGSWKDKQSGIEYEFPGRFTLPPGHYVTKPWDDDRTCQPIEFDVPKHGDITYVYVDAEPKAKKGHHGECQNIVTRVQNVKVGP